MLNFANTELKRRIIQLEAKLLDQEKTGRKLQDSEKRYRRLFESAKDGILILDAGMGRVGDVNPYLLDLLGCLYDELFEQCIWKIGVLKDIAASREAFWSLQENKYIRYEDLPLEIRNGYSGRSYWSKAHWNWTADIKMPHRGQQNVLQDGSCSSGAGRTHPTADSADSVVPQLYLAPLVKAFSDNFV